MVAIPDPKGRKPIPIQEEKRELKKGSPVKTCVYPYIIDSL
jgi:hypothetical protein